MLVCDVDVRHIEITVMYFWSLNQYVNSPKTQIAKRWSKGFYGFYGHMQYTHFSIEPYLHEVLVQCLKRKLGNMY